MNRQDPPRKPVADTATQKDIPDTQPVTIGKLLQQAVEHHSAGRLSEAESLYHTVLELDSLQFDALHLTGVLALQEQNYTLAFDRISQALGQRPNDVGANNNMGTVLKAQGQYENAIDHFSRAITLNPESVDGHYNIAGAYKLTDRLELAIESYKTALRLDANHVRSYINLGVTYAELGRFEDALNSYLRALEISPNYVEIHYNVANVYRSLGQSKAALEYFTNAVRLKPDYVEAHNNMGALYRELDQLDLATQSYRSALHFQPDYAEAHNNLGACLKDQGNLRDAVSSYQAALEVDPNYVDAHWNLGLSLLQLGELERGWLEYEWRLKNKNDAGRVFDMPVWQGSDLIEKSIFVYAEQGIGDELSFAGCLPDLIAMSPKAVYLDCDPRLEPLLARSFPKITVSRKSADNNLPWVNGGPTPDYCQAIGSLPKFFRTCAEDFTEAKPYLFADPEQVTSWTNRLCRLGSGLKIGISWRGGKDAMIARRASVPLDCWKPLLSLDAQFINLQYGETAQEISELGDEYADKIWTWDDFDRRNDLDSMAALISALDLVITIDNATLHMAGALGANVWGLLSSPSSWRWSENLGLSTSAYTSTHLYRQTVPFEWDQVIVDVTSSLKSRIFAFNQGNVDEA